MDKSKDVVINTKKLCKSYTNGEVQQHVIKNMDIQLFNKDFTVFMGPSGSGKSTLLHMLSGMDKILPFSLDHLVPENPLCSICFREWTGQAWGKSTLKALISQNTLKSSWRSFGGLTAVMFFSRFILLTV